MVWTKLFWLRVLKCLKSKTIIHTRCAVDEEKKSLDWGMAFSAVACVVLGIGLVLFIRNNALFAHGGQNLWHVESLVMLGVIGIPFVLMALHVIRSVKLFRHRRS